MFALHPNSHVVQQLAEQSTETDTGSTPTNK